MKKYNLYTRLTVCYIVLLLSATISVIGVSLIPHRLIEKNCKESIELLYEKGEGPLFLGMHIYRIDTFTDILMFNIAYCNNEQQPVESGLLNNLLNDDENKIFETSKALIDGRINEGTLTDYARYWHGYQIFLKPLLLIMNYQWMIRINYLIFTLLFLFTIYIVWKYVSFSKSLALLFSMILVGLPSIPSCIQYSICFYLMLLFICAILISRHIAQASVISFFIFGALTSFFDLLTTPLVTLGIPLTIYILRYIPNQRLREVIKVSLAWTVGYIGLWISKIVVTWLLLDNNIISSFLENVVTRSLFGLNTIKYLFKNILTYMICLCLFITTFFLIKYCSKWLRLHHDFNDKYGWLLFIILLVPFWYIVTLQHVVIHYWFVWRELVVSIFAISLLYIYKKNIGNGKNSSSYTML